MHCSVSTPACVSTRVAATRRREKKSGVPHHYKAGNMNHAMKLCSAPYVAQLDADMIPTPRCDAWCL